jgi:hypothetical protein
MAHRHVMRTVDTTHVAAPPETVWPFAAQVERWPDHLAHYRWVKRSRGEAGGDGVVEMSAWRPFGVFNWPTWWESEMQVDATRHEVRYRHVRGITKGMDVLWTLTPDGQGGTDVTIVHEWDGPAWPLIGPLAARVVIGPVFVHGIASRTLAGLRRAAEAAR